MAIHRVVYVLALVTNFGGCGDPLMKDVAASQPPASDGLHAHRHNSPMERNPSMARSSPTGRKRASGKKTVSSSGKKPQVDYERAPFTGEYVKRMRYSDVIDSISIRLRQLGKAKDRGPLAAAEKFYSEYMRLVRNLDEAEEAPHRDIDPECPPKDLTIEANESSIPIKRGKYIAHGSSSRIFKSPPVAELDGRTLIIKSLGPLPDDNNKLDRKRVISRKIKLALLEDQAFMLAFANFDKLAPHAYELSEDGMDKYCHARTIVSENVGATELGSIPASLRQNPRELAAIGASALDIIRRIHSTGLIHGDIHKRNFIVKDASRPAKTLRIIDFGRVELFMIPHPTNYPSETTLIPDNPNPQLNNDGWSPRLLSPWEMEGHRPNRRDDLFRIAEMLLFMFGDSTFHTNYDNAEREYKRSRKSDSAMKKFLTRVIDLKKNRMFSPTLPQQVKEFYLYTLSLGYFDEPNYQEWIDKLRAQ